MININFNPSLLATPPKPTVPARNSQSPTTVCEDEFTSRASSDSSPLTSTTNILSTTFQDYTEPTPLERALVAISPYLCGIGPSTEDVQKLRSDIEKYDLNQTLASRNYSPKKSS